MKWNHISLICLLFAIASCASDDSIPADLQLYLDRFEEEAAKQGENYSDDIENTKIQLVEIVTSGVLGQCVRDPDDDFTAIQIDKTYWATATDLEKEFVVFHELGHCVLNRDHTNIPNAEGFCRSIMYDGFGSQCDLSYNEDTREEMVEELFN